MTEPRGPSGAYDPGSERRRLESLLADVLRSAYLLRVLASTDSNKRRAAVFERIAEDDLNHASFIAQRLGVSAPPLRPRPFGPFGVFLYVAAKVFGAKRIASIVGRTHRDISSSFAQISDGQIHSAEERLHGEVIQRIVEGEHDDSGVGTPLIGFLSWRGGVLRAAILGVNDGLVSNFGLVMGVAGGTNDSGLVALAGVAGLLAGAISMGVGEYVSIRSQRDFFEYMIGREKAALQVRPEQAVDDIARLYEDRGLTQDEALIVAQRLMTHPEMALETKIREEIGLNPEDLGSPWAAAVSSLSAFSLGAVVPVIPFIIASGNDAIIGSALAAGGALVTVGAGLAWMSGISPVRGGLRMLLLGAAAAAITFGIGSAVGLSL